MSVLGCCRTEADHPRLTDQQRRARALVGIASLGLALLTRRRTGVVGALTAAAAGWFGASHLVAARTGYPGCPELGAIATVLLRREVRVGCAPWRIVDRRLGLGAVALDGGPDARAEDVIGVEVRAGLHRRQAAIAVGSPWRARAMRSLVQAAASSVDLRERRVSTADRHEVTPSR